MYKDFGSPGEIIERLGAKELSIGGAEISRHHGNFILNKNNATSIDVLKLISLIKNRVEVETGYSMKAEVLYLNSAGKLMPADELY